MRRRWGSDTVKSQASVHYVLTDLDLERFRQGVLAAKRYLAQAEEELDLGDKVEASKWVEKAVMVLERLNSDLLEIIQSG